GFFLESQRVIPHVKHKILCFDIQRISLASARSLPHCGRSLHTPPPKSKQFLVSDAMSRHGHGHRHFYRFLVNLGKCAASRCHVTLDSRDRRDVSDDEHQMVKSHPVPRLRMVGRTQRSFGVTLIALTGCLSWRSSTPSTSCARSCC